MLRTISPLMTAIFLFICMLFLSPLYAGKPQISLEDIWKDRVFIPKSIHLGKSMRDGEHYTRVENRNQLNMYEYATGNFVRTLVNVDGFLFDEEGNTPAIDDYFFSADEQRVLLAFNTQSIFRHSSMSQFFVFDIAGQQMTSLSDLGMQRIPRFSPDGNKVAFVRNNNIFVKNIIGGEEKQITHDGLHNHIINGTTDWVYEEEFGFTQGFEWSPDGSSIAYYRFDETLVKEFNMMLYGFLYPEEYRFKYPKAGEANALVSIHIYDTESGKTITVDTGDEPDQYIPRIKWTNNPGSLAVYRLNRHQNHLEILLADAQNGTTSVLYEETNKYYIDINDDLTFLKDGKSFIISSERDGFNHLYHYDMRGRLIRQITSGNWDVNAFMGLEEANKLLFYTSFEDGPVQNQLYTISLNGRTKRKLTSQPGYHHPSFSESFKYFINNHTTINTPPVVSIHNARGEQIRVLEDNASLQKKLEDYGYVEADFITIPLTEGPELNAWIIKPADFNPEEQYPVLMYVYGGPGSQTVTDRWNVFNGAWFQMLAQMGYIVVSVDNRGTGGRGEEFKKMTYMQLGKYEALDQIEAAKYLAGLDYIDAERIGIFGWSYGGYLSSLCLALGADVFKAAIAVAPVTNWRFYDTIYTERYMRTPQENASGYDDNSPINHVDKIKGSLLLVHGSADDNVHYQNTLEMAGALIDANVDFEKMIYPNYDHGISGGNSRLHLYRLMNNFLERTLKESQP